MTSSEILVALIKSVITNRKAEFSGGFDFDEVALYKLAKKHDLAHLLADAFKINGIEIKNAETEKKIKREKMLAIYRETRMGDVLNIVRDIFDKAGIEYAPLKGAVIRGYYPEPWMRTSCDIDVLVKEEDFDMALRLLTEGGFKTDGIRHYHDVNLFYGDVHLELHFSIAEEDERFNADLDKVWEHVVEKGDYERAEENNFFIFHFLAHTAFHFLSGGSGVRSVLDLWILKNAEFYREDELTPLLKDNGLTEFYNGLICLSEVWFSGKEHTDLTRRMESYIADGGSYGNAETSAVMRIAGKDKSKFGYLFKIAFLPYKNMCVLYPVLIKHKLLLPLFWVIRWFSRLFGKNRKKNKKRVSGVVAIPKERVENAENLLKDLGLK